MTFSYEKGPQNVYRAKTRLGAVRDGGLDAWNLGFSNITSLDAAIILIRTLIPLNILNIRCTYCLHDYMRCDIASCGPWRAQFPIHFWRLSCPNLK